MTVMYISISLCIYIYILSSTCRDIQTAIIKTCAYNNRFALKCAFGKAYDDLYPGTIYSPPSYDVHFLSADNCAS